MEAFLESPSRLWAGGPAPGQFYHIPPTPGASMEPASSPYGGPITRTQNPMVTGTSVLGVKFEGGVVIAADMLGSYGSLARFRNISRIMRVNDSTMLGASGDYADFQYLKQVLGQMVIDEELLGDGHSYSPRAIHSWLTRAMYSRRSKMNPLWNTMVIGGYADGESFLGYVDMLGVAYEAPSLATGYGAYLAQPLLREVLEKQPVLSQSEARELVERCMRVLYYRDARSYNRFQIATVTEKGVEIEGPLSAETNWEIAHMIRSQSSLSIKRNKESHRVSRISTSGLSCF
ncbi:proteasome subunit beta type-4 isoform X2 [Neovison vison]|uniref:proteasome subunit beta type-4 isoform X2 n=1 Tax=Neovison vison TaxID=452646 RepID=UPI001CF05D27|nr:proteasome subunit beta type-4 isoform X2 [Neogale vison]